MWLLIKPWNVIFNMHKVTPKPLFLVRANFTVIYYQSVIQCNMFQTDYWQTRYLKDLKYNSTSHSVLIIRVDKINIRSHRYDSRKVESISQRQKQGLSRLSSKLDHGLLFYSDKREPPRRKQYLLSNNSYVFTSRLF